MRSADLSVSGPAKMEPDLKRGGVVAEILQAIL